MPIPISNILPTESPEIISGLSRVPQLQVMARSTVFSYKGREANVQKVGTDLNVDAVLLGRIAQQGDTLMIQADLVKVADGSELWGDQYNRKVSDLITVQQDISKEIYENLRPTLMGKQAGQLAEHETKILTLTGFTCKVSSIQQVGQKKDSARRLLISIRPSKRSELRAGVCRPCEYLQLSGPVGYNTPSKVWQNAKKAATQAVQLDDQLPEAHIALALVQRPDYDWNWAGAESEFKKAIQLNANSATAHQWYADFLIRMGRFEQGELELKKAQELDTCHCSWIPGIGRRLLRGSTTPQSNNFRKR